MWSRFVRSLALLMALTLSVDSHPHRRAAIRQGRGRTRRKGRGAPAPPSPGEAPHITRPGLFFKEEWKAPATKSGEHPLTAESNDNPNLEMTLYVPSGQADITGTTG